MPQYLQTNRPLRVTTALGSDKLLLAGVQGHEGISTPFLFHLDLRSEDGDIDGAALLRTPVSVVIETEKADAPRRIHGRISRFAQLGQKDDLTAYRAEIVPWLWFLSLHRDCRIFQDMSALEIVQKVFTDRGFTDFRNACSGSFAKREYCVQYRETDLDFVSRLMEEEGVFYFFEHAQDKHTLVLADTNGAIQASAALPSARMSSQTGQADVVSSLSSEDAVRPRKITLYDYDYTKPNLSLHSTLGGTDAEEVYDYPGRFAEKNLGDRQARLQLEAEEAAQHVVRGESTCRGIQAGTRFELESHFRRAANQTYIVTEVTLSARLDNFRGWDNADSEYHNDFLAIPSGTPFRPSRRTPRPIIAGTQTALVVGKAGEEIWTDSQGRVKIQFHWDRVGKNDDKSSCWVRVSSAWAGKQWGAVHIPRMGQEVVVAFLEGDPDRPLVVGSVYNAEQSPPYALPASQTQSGVKSRSSKGGGGFNEIRLEDKKDSEQVSVQAQKDLATLVKNDETREVDNDRTTTIKRDETRKVGRDDTLTVDRDQKVEVTQGDQTVTVKKGGQTVQVTQGKQTITVDQGNQEITLGQGDRVVHLKGGDHERNIDQGNDSVTLKMGNREVKLSMGDLTTKAALGKISYSAMQGIELKVGQNSIKIDQTGVTIKGLMVKVEGQVQTEVKGLLTKVKADVMLQAGGAITMIG